MKIKILLFTIGIVPYMILTIFMNFLWKNSFGTPFGYSHSLIYGLQTFVLKDLYIQSAIFISSFIGIFTIWYFLCKILRVIFTYGDLF